MARRAKQLWLSPRQVDADVIFDRDWDNLRVAHAWAVATRNLAAEAAPGAEVRPRA